MECSETPLASLSVHPVLRAVAEEAGGGAVHLVGGALRDRWLRPELEPHDLDVVVAGGGAGLAARLAHRLRATLVPLGGERFAAFRLVGPGGGWVLDIWDRESGTLEADLARRDLTINALALDLVTGEVLDPFGGLEDLRARRLRAVTVRSFVEDPLRVLRLARFAATLDGFSVEPDTLRLAREAAPGLAAVARERMRDELGRIFAANGALAGLEVLAATGLFPALWGGEEGSRELPVDLRRGLAAISADTELAARSHAPLLRWVLTCRALPGPETRPEETPDRLLERGLVSREEARAMKVLLGLGAIPEDLGGQRRYLHRAGRYAAAALDLRRLAEDEREGTLRRLLDEHGEQILHPPRWVDGREAAELLGLRPGPRLGEALRALEAAQVDGEVATREQALAFLRRRANPGSNYAGPS